MNIEKTTVMFRKMNSDGRVVALFPLLLWKDDGIESDLGVITCMDGFHHAPASYEAVIVKSQPATKEEYKTLLKQVKEVGYDNLIIK